MTAVIINGKEVADKKKHEIAQEVSSLKGQGGNSRLSGYPCRQ